MNFHVELCKIIYFYLLEPDNVALQKIKTLKNNAIIIEPSRVRSTLLADYYNSFDEFLIFIEENKKKKLINLIIKLKLRF